ncbi:MAG: sugar ABC transporter ATP-binding protein [Dorea formicigenerans]
MDRVGLDCSPKTLISELSVAKKQLVEIAKAISNDVKILVLDEPTAAITDKETEMLFDIIRELKKQGIGIIYISHRLSELLEIGDVCTVMRDGEYIDTVNIKDTTEDELTRLMVGRQVSFEKLENPHLKKDEVVLSVKNLNYKNLVRNVSFDLHKGEILGFAGLVGAGRTETAKTIIGDYKKDRGTVIYKGKEIGTNLSENIKNGIVYLSEDRKDEGLILMHSVAENIALPNLPKLCKPFLNRRKERSVSKDYIKSLKIKTFSELTDAKNLSGGNQQKVVIAKWLYSDADIYIFDEPTRGIDVGARDEIYNIMYDLIAKGASIIMISSDLVEVLKMSDRVVVMREGRINGIVENDGMLTQEETMKMELAEEEKHEG